MFSCMLQSSKLRFQRLLFCVSLMFPLLFMSQFLKTDLELSTLNTALENILKSMEGSGVGVASTKNMFSHQRKMSLAMKKTLMEARRKNATSKNLVAYLHADASMKSNRSSISSISISGGKDNEDLAGNEHQENSKEKPSNENTNKPSKNWSSTLEASSGGDDDDLGEHGSQDGILSLHKDVSETFSKAQMMQNLGSLEHMYRVCAMKMYIMY